MCLTLLEFWQNAGFVFLKRDGINIFGENQHEMHDFPL